MSQEKFKVQDFFQTSLTSDILANSSDGSFTVSEAPTSTKCRLVINAEDEVKREEFIIYNRVWNQLFYRGIDRLAPKAHSINDIVKMNVMAGYTNYFDDVLGTTFNLEKLTSLEVRVFGGRTYINGVLTDISDVDLIMTDDSINYIYLDLSDTTIKSSITSWDYTDNLLLYTVTTFTGSITSISRTPIPRYWGQQNAGASVWGGAEIFKWLNGSQLEFRTLTSENASVVISTVGDNIHITFDESTLDKYTQAEVNSLLSNKLNVGWTPPGMITGANNQGTGVGIFKDINSANLRFKSLKAGSGVTISASDSEITFSVWGEAIVRYVWEYDTITPTQWQTIIALSRTVWWSTGLRVRLNRQLMLEWTDYTASGQTLTWISPIVLDPNDELLIEWLLIANMESSNEWEQEEFIATEWQTVFTLLDTPNDHEAIRFMVNDWWPYTIGNDVLVSGNELTWNYTEANGGFDLEAWDTVSVYYTLTA